MMINSLEIYVSTGAVKSCQGEGVLCASAIGSCVVVCAYDSDSVAGGMAHVMLPGRSTRGDSENRTIYAEEALEELFLEMAGLGAETANLVICLVGGSDMIGDGDEGPGLTVIESVTGILARNKIKPVATELGGAERRSCDLDVTHGKILITVGDSEQRVLWAAGGDS